MPERNPHANSDGSPKDGEEFLFFDWQIKEDKERISKLPVAKKKIEEDSKKKMKDKMDS